MFRIKGVAQQYDWGKLGDESKVAELLQQSGENVDVKKPYAGDSSHMYSSQLRIEQNCGWGLTSADPLKW